MAARVELEAGARKVLGADAKLDGKTESEIMVEVLKHEDKDFDPGDRSDDYLRGRYEQTIKSTPERKTDGLDAARRAAEGGKGADKGDGKDEEPDSELAFAKHVQDHREMWKQPLLVSKDTPAN